MLYEGEDGGTSWPLSRVDRRDIAAERKRLGRLEEAMSPDDCWQKAKPERTKKVVVRCMRIDPFVRNGGRLPLTSPRWSIQMGEVCTSCALKPPSRSMRKMEGEDMAGGQQMWKAE